MGIPHESVHGYGSVMHPSSSKQAVYKVKVLECDVHDEDTSNDIFTLRNAGVGMPAPMHACTFQAINRSAWLTLKF